MFDLSKNTQRAIGAIRANPLSDPRPTALTRGKTQLGTLKLNKSYRYDDKVRAGNADVFVFKVNQSALFPGNSSTNPLIGFTGPGSFKYTLKKSNGKQFASGVSSFTVSGGSFSSEFSGSSKNLESGTYRLTIKTPSVEPISYTLNLTLTPF